jgi:hypothetical protein
MHSLLISWGEFLKHTSKTTESSNKRNKRKI